MELTPELALGIAEFNAVNERTFQMDPDSPDVRAAMRNALSIVRANAEPVGNYFGKRLAGATLAVKSKVFDFHFNTEQDAAESFKMAVRQSIDEQRAAMISWSMMNLILHDLSYKSAYDKGDDNITGMFIVAHAVDAQRRVVAQKFLQIAQDHSAKRRESLWSKALWWGVSLAVVAGLLWLRHHR